jgi:hypothetical protein
MNDMVRKNLRKIVLVFAFAVSFCAFCYLNTTGRYQSMTAFENFSPKDSTKNLTDSKKIVSKSDSLKSTSNTNKNTSVLIQDVEIMKLIIQIGKESLPVLSIKDYIPFLK